VKEELLSYVMNAESLGQRNLVGAGQYPKKQKSLLMLDIKVPQKRLLKRRT
jgi:hypothetical protein